MTDSNEQRREWPTADRLAEAATGARPFTQVHVPMKPPVEAVRFVRVGDLVREVRPVSWLVKGRLERNTTVMYYGEPEGGKSLHLLDQELHIAAGMDWHGHRVTQGAVFRLCPEGSEGLKRRARAWSIRHGVSLDALPLFTHTVALDLSDPAAALAVGDAVARLAREVGQLPQLVTVDTLSRHLGGDENSSADVARFIAHVDAHVREPTGACVSLVHHVGHGDKSRARGSTVLRGAVDTEYRVSRDPETGSVEVACTKAKDWSRPPPMHFRISSVDLGIADEDGQPVTGAVMDSIDAPLPTGSAQRPTGANQRKALDTLRRLQEDHQQRLQGGGFDPAGARVSVEEWRAACALDRSRWREVFDGLKSRGLIHLDLPHVRPAG